jgi:hypothetical protein
MLGEREPNVDTLTTADEQPRGDLESMMIVQVA